MSIVLKNSNDVTQVLDITGGGTGATNKTEALSNLGLTWKYTHAGDGTGNITLNTTNCTDSSSIECHYNDILAIFTINIYSKASWSSSNWYDLCTLSSDFISKIGHTYATRFNGAITTSYPCEFFINTWESGNKISVHPISANPASGSQFFGKCIVAVTP